MFDPVVWCSIEMHMKTILCFGDSTTWGFDPDATACSSYVVRHPWAVRWTGVLARELGGGFRVVEEGQNGRTTVHEDPIALHRNGRVYLPACLESHKPIDLVVLMLGTNDLKAVFHLPPVEIAAGVESLVRMVLQSDAGPAGKAPQLLLVCPAAVGALQHLPDLQEKFPDAVVRSRRLPEYYEAVAVRQGCAFLNSQEIVTASPVDGLHFSAGEHAKLGMAIASSVKQVFV